MLRQPVHRLPQLGFGRVAEDLGGLADPLVRVDEAEPGAPDTPVVASDAEEQGDKLIGQTEGGELVEDGVPGAGSGEPVGLSCHRSASGGGAAVLKDRMGPQVTQCVTPLLTG